MMICSVRFRAIAPRPCEDFAPLCDFFAPRGITRSVRRVILGESFQAFRPKYRPCDRRNWGIMTPSDARHALQSVPT